MPTNTIIMRTNLVNHVNGHFVPNSLSTYARNVRSYGYTVYRNMQLGAIRHSILCSLLAITLYGRSDHYRRASVYA